MAVKIMFQLKMLISITIFACLTIPEVRCTSLEDSIFKMYGTDLPSNEDILLQKTDEKLQATSTIEKSRTQKQMQRLSKRDTISAVNECTDYQSTGRSGMQVVMDIKPSHYVFSVNLRENFTLLRFNMFIDNNLDFASHYITTNSLDFTDNALKMIDRNTWVDVDVAHYIQEVSPSLTSLGRDKLALRVTIGNITKSLISKRWRRTHSYKGFRVSVKGDADFLFGCPTPYSEESAPITQLNKPLLLGGILGACFLLMIVGWVLYLILKRPREESYDQKPPVPELPASLLLGKKVNQCPDPDHIYEEFNEDTLARLRQKMNPTNLREAENLKEGRPSTALSTLEEDIDDIKQRARQEDTHVTSGAAAMPLDFSGGKYGEYDVPKSFKGPKILGGINPIYQNEINMTLIEEKIQNSGRNSIQETQYIEMHGILDRNSKHDMGN